VKDETYGLVGPWGAGRKRCRRRLLTAVVESKASGAPDPVEPLTRPSKIYLEHVQPQASPGETSYVGRLVKQTLRVVEKGIFLVNIGRENRLGRLSQEALLRVPGSVNPVLLPPLGTPLADALTRHRLSHVKRTHDMP
jgi:hypothetical protein